MSLKNLPQEIALTPDDLKILLVNYRDIESLRGMNPELDKGINYIVDYYNEKFFNISDNWAKDPQDLINQLFAEDDTNALKYLINNFPYTQLIAEDAIINANDEILKYVLDNGNDYNLDELLKVAQENENAEAVDLITKAQEEETE